MYLESGAWSYSLKHRLACGSTLLMPTPEFPEWLTRGLQPNVHYVDLGPGSREDLCDVYVSRVRHSILGQGCMHPLLSSLFCCS